MSHQEVSNPATAAPAEGPNDADMAAKYDAAQNPETFTGKEPAVEAERPEGLPENFKSVDDMTKSYKELQAELTRLKQGAKPDDNKEEGQENAPAPEGQEENAPAEESARDAVENAGLNFDSLSNEYAQNGALSDAAYDQLEKAGIPKSMVDQFIAGQEAIYAAAQVAAHALVGGSENYSTMIDWARGNLSEAEVNSYNAAVTGNDDAARRMAIEGLYSRYTADQGSEPRLVTGNEPANSSGVFNSTAEITAAMRDPRYGKDVAYTRMVEAKVGRSNVM